MTKAQAIKALKALGVTDITNAGKFSIFATVPTSKGTERGLFDPRDLLAELMARSSR